MRLAGGKHSDHDGSARWWSPARGVFCAEVSGHYGMAAVQLMFEGFHAVIADSDTAGDVVGIHSFHDLAAVKSYDSAARVAYTEQSKPLIHRFEGVEMLFSSRLIAMSIEVANIVLGGKLKGTTDRAAFERRRDDVIAARMR
ncbi:MAG TPA: hypothetical protein VGF99_20050 [Myxococcota bacterium]